MDYEIKLKKYIEENNIEAEHMHFEKSVHTVEEACEQTNAQPDDFIKSICMIGEIGTVVAIVSGSQRASTTRVAQAVGSDVRIATPQEVLERTGYIVGGTPPFGYPAIFLIDPIVMEKDFVYAGGGTPNALIKITPKEIQKANEGILARVRK
jgi:prolyl-tRNA editing enzyme YbaK/EbsC (Cys-tRNA(Pro) deacylase)